MNEQTLTYTFLRLRKRFLRQAMRMLPSLEDAEDALQDAFVRLWPRAESLQTATEVEALTATTIRRIGIDSYRKRATRPTTGSSLNLQDEPPDEHTPDTDNAERLREVEAWMERSLSPLQQRIIALKEYDDRSYADIAATLQMSETAVRMQLSRARKLLREHFAIQN